MKMHKSTYCVISNLINMRESSCQSKKQVMVIWNWSSGEFCGPWASCFMTQDPGELYQANLFSCEAGPQEVEP